MAAALVCPLAAGPHWPARSAKRSTGEHHFMHPRGQPESQIEEPSRATTTKHLLLRRIPLITEWTRLARRADVDGRRAIDGRLKDKER